MNKTMAVGLVLVGIALGCGASAMRPITMSSAQQPGGSPWSCYVADRLPDLRDAAEWKGALKIKQGLDQIAPNSPPGTILPIQPGGTYSDVVCVKH